MNGKWKYALATFVGALIVVAGMTGCSDEQSEAATESVSRKSEVKPALQIVRTLTNKSGFQRWAIVESRMKWEEEGPWKVYRHYVVSPKGKWYFVPEAHKEWANSITEGQEVILPKSIPCWVLFAEHRTDFDPLNGEFQRSTYKDSSKRSIPRTSRGVYFFGTYAN